VSVELVGLALLMGLVTYPSRALPMLAPGIERLPTIAIEYLRLVGPAILAALAIVNVSVIEDPDGGQLFHVGIEWAAVAVAGALTVWRRNLLIGLIGAVILVAVAREIGFTAFPI
jgi:branched-subunit amino acid transport protein